jgi:hypothetical protein
LCQQKRNENALSIHSWECREVIGYILANAAGSREVAARDNAAAARTNVSQSFLANFLKKHTIPIGKIHE